MPNDTLPDWEQVLSAAVLILKRNATRDYLDFVALTDHMGAEEVVAAF
ncbi:MAG: hypothetical protein M3495_05955 [Pseudomonadota bacterium]|nr:hypothetical protein [Pseudomonadota bacterium]